MGTIRKRGNKYYAEVCVNRGRRGKTCRTKAAADAWIKATEKEGLQTAHTFGEACKRYRETYTVRKRTRKAEEKRLDRLEAWFGTQTSLAQITPDRLAEWRDTRLQEVSAATVRRDWNLLHHLLAVAVREWEWLSTNPLSKLTRPKKPQPRSRVWSPAEVETYLQACGWPGNTLTARTGACLLFALETGMRASEITRIRPEHVMGRTVHVPTTKNGELSPAPGKKKPGPVGAGVRVCLPVRNVVMNQQLSLLSHDYEGTPVHFQENGYLNATEAARRFGKEPRRFLETEPAKRKIRQIAEKLLIDKNQIVIVRRGAPETGGGTWFHPKLAVTYAAWLDSEGCATLHPCRRDPRPGRE